MADSSFSTKRYTPPNQRKSSGNRRKSGVRTSSQKSNNGERNQPLATGLQMEEKSQRIITLKDCSRSEAYQLLSQRWAAAMHQYNDPTVDLSGEIKGLQVFLNPFCWTCSERPIMYYGGSVWGKLPHQILAAANKKLPPQSISPKDYMTEVRRGLLMPKPSSSNN